MPAQLSNECEWQVKSIIFEKVFVYQSLWELCQEFSCRFCGICIERSPINTCWAVLFLRECADNQNSLNEKRAKDSESMAISTDWTEISMWKMISMVVPLTYSYFFGYPNPVLTTWHHNLIIKIFNFFYVGIVYKAISNFRTDETFSRKLHSID